MGNYNIVLKHQNRFLYWHRTRHETIISEIPQTAQYMQHLPQTHAASWCFRTCWLTAYAWICMYAISSGLLCTRWPLQSTHPLGQGQLGVGLKHGDLISHVCFVMMQQWSIVLPDTIKQSPHTGSGSHQCCRSWWHRRKLPPQSSTRPCHLRAPARQTSASACMHRNKEASHWYKIQRIGLEDNVVRGLVSALDQVVFGLIRRLQGLFSCQNAC